MALPEPKPSLEVVGPVWLSSAFEQLGIIYEQDQSSNADTSYTAVQGVKQELTSRCNVGELHACRGGNFSSEAQPPSAVGAVVLTADPWVKLHREIEAEGRVNQTALPLAAIGIGVAYQCRANRTCEPLVLDTSAIGWLCSGKISRWDDDYLISLNPWLAGVGAIPIALQAEPATSDTMAALREQLIALGQLSEPIDLFCPAAHVQPSAARVSSAVLHDEYSVGLLPVANSATVLHGWASVATTCSTSMLHPSPLSAGAAVSCRARATPPAISHLRGCTRRQTTHEERPPGTCYPLTVYALLMVCPARPLFSLSSPNLGLFPHLTSLPSHMRPPFGPARCPPRSTAPNARRSRRRACPSSSRAT